MNLYVNRDIASAFRRVAKSYDNRLGLCATASMLMFLAADPHDQGEFIRRVLDSELKGQVDELLNEIRAEQREISAQEPATEKASQLAAKNAKKG